MTELHTNSPPPKEEPAPAVAEAGLLAPPKGHNNSDHDSGPVRSVPYVPELDDDATGLEAAMAYANAGVYVLPVRRGTKDPGSVVGKGWPGKSTRDPETIAALWAATDHGVALDLGRSGLVVIDVDDPTLVPSWLASALVESGAPYQSTRPDTLGRGHYIFRQPVTA